MPTSTFDIRQIAADDVPTVVGLVHDLAEYERAAASCLLTDAQLTAALFGPDQNLFGHVATVDGTVVGFTLWFRNFSTWHGVAGIYLEDLYVRPEHRGGGIGRALLTKLAAICVRNGSARLEWAVLKWNQPSIDFYRSLGATEQGDWFVYRLDGAALQKLGSS